uniref:hypothetical protein n=1 Tax=Derxia lacustris TaxID=764842 RepID=UPI0015937CC6
RQIGARLGEANTLQALGQLKQRGDDLAGARVDFDAALGLYRQIGDRLGEANTLQALGTLAAAEGRPVAAFAQLHACLAIQNVLADRVGAAGTHGYLARIAGSVGAGLQAQALCSLAIRQFTAIDDRWGVLLAAQDLGRVLLGTEDGFIGVCALELARATAEQIGDPRAEALGQVIAGLMSEDMSDTDRRAALDQLTAEAPAVLAEFHARIDAAIAAGEIDPYAPLQAGATDAD